MEPKTSFEGNASSSNCSWKANSRKSSSSTLGGTLHFCKCGKVVEVRTSWTNNNPDRRFRGCPGPGGSYCSSFEWVDPPMCQRAREVIPGLLKRINQKEEAIKHYNDRLTKLIESRRRYFNKEMDDVFIEALVDELTPIDFRGNGVLTVGALCAAQSAVNDRFGTRLSYRYCVERVKHLRDRFNTFLWLIRRPDVFWLKRWKLLYADGEEWAQICSKNPFALAYHWKPEPKWDELNIIFSHPGSDAESSSDIAANSSGS